MKKYNVNIDRQKPSSEEIMAGRDFDGLMKQYAAASGTVVKKPFWKSGWFVGSMVTAVVAVSALVIYNPQHPANGNDKSKQTALPPAGIKDPAAGQNNQKVVAADPTINSANLPHKRSILPPMPKLNVKNFAYHVNSAKGATITHTSGTKLIFPANAFVDAAGNPVNGNVDIQYREFRDQVDFFLSGIPLQYDSAGQTYQFESAGMMQIQGTINGQPVFLAKDKTVKVEFASKETGNKFNLYKFDETAGNWNYLGKDKVVIPSADPKQDSIDAINAAMKGPGRMCNFIAEMQEPVMPEKPLKADKRKNRFTVAVNPVEFPEMKQYKDMIFEVDESNQKFDRAWYKVTWESIKLSRGDGENKYRIALHKADQHIMLDVYPVLDDKNFTDAMTEYDKKMIEYKDQLEKYKQYQEQQKAQQNGIFVRQNGDVMKPVDGGFMYYSKAKEADEKKAEMAMHSFTVSGFGVYNMDAVDALPKGAIVNLNVNDANGKLFKDFATMYHVDRKKKSLYTYHNGNPLAGFHFNPESSNLVWAVKDGQLYYADNIQFVTLSHSGTASIKLAPVGREFKSADEMRAFFKIGNSN